MAEDLSKLPVDVLRARLKSAQAVQRTVIGIFAVIVLAWIVLGYWRTQLPVFISTVAMGAGTVGVTSMFPRVLQAEIERRDSA